MPTVQLKEFLKGNTGRVVGNVSDIMAKQQQANPDIIDRLGSDYMNITKGIGSAVSEGADLMSQGTLGGIARGAVRSTTGATSGVLSSAFAPIGEVTKSLVPGEGYLAEAARGALGGAALGGVSGAAASPLGSIAGAAAGVIPGALMGLGFKGYEDLKNWFLEQPLGKTLATKYPDIVADADSIVNIAAALLGERKVKNIGENTLAGSLKGEVPPGPDGGAPPGPPGSPSLPARIISGGKSLASAGLDVAKQGIEYAAGMPERARTNLADQATQQAEVAKLPPVGQKAVENGINIRDANLVTNATPSERTLYKTMTAAAEKFSTDRTAVNPADIVGQQFRTRITDLEATQSDIGKQLGALAEQIPKIKIAGASDAVLARMQKVPGLEGLKLTKKGNLDFSDTTLSGSQTSSDRMALQKSFSDIQSRNPFQLHKLRQELFEVLGGKKRALTQLTATQEGGLNAMRQGLSDVLDAANPGYKKLNMEYAKASAPLQGVRKFFKNVLGADQDILDMTAGNLARRLTSNAPSGVELTKLIRDMEAVLSSKGKKYSVSVESAQNFLNALNRYYDLAPDTALAGQVKLGMPTSLKGLAGKAAGKAFEVFGKTTAVQRKALLDLLNADSLPNVEGGVPKTQGSENFKKKFATQNPTPDNLKAYYTEAKSVEPVFIKQTANIAGVFDGAYMYRLKTPESVSIKLSRRVNKGTTLGELGDTLGSTVIVKENLIDAAIAKAKKTSKITKVDDFRNNPTFLGYRAVHLDVEMPNGMAGEMQFNTSKGIIQKTYAHPIYDKWRKYIESPGGSTLEDVIKRVPLEKLDEFLNDVTFSQSIYNGTTQIPKSIVKEAASKLIKP